MWQRCSPGSHRQRGPALLITSFCTGKGCMRCFILSLEIGFKVLMAASFEPVRGWHQGKGLASTSGPRTGLRTGPSPREASPCSSPTSAPPWPTSLPRAPRSRGPMPSPAFQRRSGTTPRCSSRGRSQIRGSSTMCPLGRKLTSCGLHTIELTVLTRHFACGL